MSLADFLNKRKGIAPSAPQNSPAAVAGAAVAQVAAAAPAATPVSRSKADMFRGLGTAKASFQSNYLRAGHYILRIDGLKADENRKKRLFLAVEMTVMFVLDNAEGKGHRAGESCTHMLMQDNDSFLGNVKSMVAAIMGCSAEEVDEGIAVDLCSDEQPLKGTICEVEAKQIIIQKTGKPFTQVSYKGEVAAADLAQVIDPKIKAIHYPNGALEAQIKFEAKKLAAAGVPTAPTA